jgi:hypothetical protein
VFLEHGTRGLKSRSNPEERELTLARAKIGELMMRLEPAEPAGRRRDHRARNESQFRWRSARRQGPPALPLGVAAERHRLRVLENLKTGWSTAW